MNYVCSVILKATFEPLYYGSYYPAIGIYTSCVLQVDNCYMDPLINLSLLPHVIALL